MLQNRRESSPAPTPPNIDMPLRSPDLPALKTESCPHLGIREDPQTCLAYPAEWNLCHRARPVSTVSLEHQRVLCLSPVYMHCPVFLSEGSAPLPKRFRGPQTASRLKWVWLALSILLVAFGLWGAWRTQSGRVLPFLGMIPLATVPGSSKISAPAVSATPLGAFTRTPSPATFSPPAPKPASSLTPAALKTCGYGLETPIELGGQAITLHKVRRGESVDLLATSYETSLEAMQALNYFLPSPLWAELVIVIPVGGLQDAAGPILEPYLVPEPGVPVASLAGQFSITAEELIQTNSLDPGCPAVSGWVLIPHPDHRQP
jgi:hypothetical protein